MIETPTTNAQFEKLPTIEQHETNVAKELFPHIQGHLKLLESIYRAAGLAFMGAFPELNASIAKRVCSRLLIRLNNDLRAAMVLAEIGYGVQANALAASIYECAFNYCIHRR